MKRYCLFLLLISPLFMAFQCEDDIGLLDDQLIDANGNVYSTIQIGDQIWMAQNLRTTSFNDGTPIPEYSFGMDWHNGNAPVAYFQWANTDDLNDILDFELSIDYYGAMYNHYAIESGKLAPAGWRIPTAADFLELQRYLSEQGYSGREATALKSAMGWLPSSGNGIDAIGPPRGARATQPRKSRQED